MKSFAKPHYFLHLKLKREAERGKEKKKSKLAFEPLRGQKAGDRAHGRAAWCHRVPVSRLPSTARKIVPKCRQWGLPSLMPPAVDCRMRPHQILIMSQQHHRDREYLQRIHERRRSRARSHSRTRPNSRSRSPQHRSRFSRSDRYSQYSHHHSRRHSRSRSRSRSRGHSRSDPRNRQEHSSGFEFSRRDRRGQGEGHPAPSMFFWQQ